MASVTIIHYTHKINSDDTSPIVIQVIDGKPKKRTLANVLPEQWDKAKQRVIPKSHPNYGAINIKISNEYNRVEKLILSNSFDLQRDFIEYFDNLKNGTEEIKPVEKQKTFLEIIPFYISSLKSGFSMVGYESRLKYFAREANVENLTLSEITKPHMDAFILFMQSKGNQRSTMRTQLKIVRYLSSFAADNGYGPYPGNPVIHKFALPIAGRSVKAKLDKEELGAFKEFKVLDDTTTLEMQDMFMLAIYLRGMRIGDVIQLRQDYFKDGRLIYESGKNKKLFNIKLIPEALEIVNKYLDGREYLFTFFKHKDNPLFSREQNMKALANHVKSITAYTNKQLKQIAGDAGLTKSISTHIARHTFAKMAIEKVKDFNLSMDLIGHSNIKEHQLYIREISEAEDLDNAADDIFG